jgi:hypothetical protein
MEQGSSFTAPMVCRECGSQIQPDGDVLESLPARLTAATYADCIYKCAWCGAGYSNGTNPDTRTLIWPYPALNVPHQVRWDSAQVLSRSVNETNRKSKATRFGFSTSEDAVTWTMVKGLESEGRLDALIPPQTRSEGDPSVLLWGAPAGGPSAEAVADALSRVSAQLGEDRRTEPDLVLAWPDHVAFIEVKYRSGNEHKPNYAGFSKYLGRLELFAVPSAEIEASGFYELVRDWRIGIEVTEILGAPMFTLVNLGPPKISKSAAHAQEQFALSPTRSFIHRTWDEVLDDAAPLPAWLDDYASRTWPT